MIVNAENGNIITTLPTGMGVDTVAFNPATMEAISAEGGGSMTFIKENSPTSFAVEQTLQTKAGAKTLALDTKTNHVLTMTAEFGPPPANAPPATSRTPCPWSHGAGFVFNSDGGQVVDSLLELNPLEERRRPPALAGNAVAADLSSSKPRIEKSTGRTYGLPTSLWRIVPGSRATRKLSRT